MADRTIVVIPARGRSTRFPRKNIALLAGRPLIDYSIQAALAASTIDGTYVSTDDHEISAIARDCGAEVPFLRPAELAGDRVTADEVVAHMIRGLRDKESKPIANVVLIQPTSPFVKAAHIDAAVQMLNTSPDLQSVTTMSPLDHRHHPYNLSFPTGNCTWEFFFPKERAESISRQSKPAAQKFCNLFAARTECFLTQGRFGTIKGYIELDPVFAWDIDYEWELVLAETLISRGFVDPRP